MLEAPGVAPVWWSRVAPLIVETMTARCAEWVRWFNADRLHSSNDRVWCGLVRHPSTSWMLPRRGGMSSHWRRSRYEKFRSDVIAVEDYLCGWVKARRRRQDRWRLDLELRRAPELKEAANRSNRCENLRGQVAQSPISQ